MELKNKEYYLIATEFDGIESDYIKFTQNDTNNSVLNISVPYPSDQLLLCVTKPDGNDVVDRFVASDETNTNFNMELPINLINLPGTYKATVQAYGHDDDRRTVGTFKYRIASDFNTDFIESNENYPVLTKLISDVNSLYDKVVDIDHGEGGRILAEEQRVQAEIVRKGNEVIRENQEIAREERLKEVESSLETKMSKNDTLLELTKKRNIQDLIKLNDVDEEFLNAIQGSGSTITIESIPKDKSVTIDKTAFISKYNNLYNYKSAIDGYVIVTGGLPSESVDYCITDFIEVDLNTTYITKNVTKANYYDINKNSLGSKSFTDTDNTMSTSTNRKFVRLSILIKNKYVAQFEKGAELTSTKFGGVLSNDIEIPSENITPITLDKIGFLKKSTNLFNNETVKYDTIVNTTGVEVPSTSGNAISDFIMVEPNTEYFVKNSFVVVRYTKDKRFISRPDTNGLFTTPYNCFYIRLMLSNDNVEAEQLNKGNQLLSYEEYYNWFSDEIVPPSNLLNNNVGTVSNVYYTPCSVPNEYDCMIENTVKIDTIENYYANLDVLVNNNQNYIEKTLLGNDSSNTYPIYSYKLKPNNVIASRLVKTLPKLVIICGIHGIEKSSIYSCYYLIKDICENWTKSEALEYLRWNCEIVILPIANPYGFTVTDTSTYGGRQNVNKVDINRNFPTQWELGVLGSETYGGETPLSEKETQYIKSIIDNNKDSIYIGDYHTNAGGGDDYSTLLWHSQTVGSYLNENLDIASTFAIGKFSRHLTKKYELPIENLNYGYVSYSNVNGSAKLYSASIGVNSNTIECYRKFPTESVVESNQNIKSCVEYLGNWLLTILNQFNK